MHPQRPTPAPLPASSVRVQQIGNASGVAVIGATYFGLAASHSMRTAVIVCLASLIAALSLLALLLPRGREPSAF